MPPLILSLKFDAASFERLDDLRRAHFPPARNVLKAHLTLFHALPGEQETLVRAAIEELCAQTQVMKLAFPDVFSLGKGVAVRVECPELEAFRRELQGRFRAFLGAQDLQRMRPHVTVQNKVSPEAARALFASLGQNWRAFEGFGNGVSLWRYRGGPWELVTEWDFAPAQLLS